MWKDGGQREAGCELGVRFALRVKTVSGAYAERIAGPGDIYEARPEQAHAIPLIGQALLMATEAGHLHAVEPLLEQMRHLAKCFHDSETLGRIGRLFKDSGDEKWERQQQSGATSPSRTTWLQMYDKAFAAYAEAFETTRDWYVGINAATLALLTGKDDLARQYASEVARICEDERKNNVKDRYWLFASEGEAALILGRDAVPFYRDALESLTPGQWGMANGTYKQACRLWRLLKERGEGDRVVSVLELFEASEARAYLQPQFLGRAFCGASS
jgi:hypothetical protein